MDPTVAAQQQPPQTPSQLPPEALQLATTLFNATRQDNHVLLQSHLSAGLKPNLTDAQGNTLLMLAAYHGHAQTVSLLLSHNAAVDALNDRGQSILAGAVFKGHEAVVKMLLEQGRADVNLGQPSAVETGKMFRRRGCLRLMGVPEEEWERGVEGLIVPSRSS